MSPRHYQSTQRQVGVDQTRARIIEAAREIIMSSGGFALFTIDAVARQANVARMTVYYQFGSKIGLLEALCDSLASQGGMEQLATAFRQPEPLTALSEYILIFSRFWDSDRLVTRRLRALAALDPELEQVVRKRDEWRRKGLGVLVERISETHNQPIVEARDEVINILYTLVSFENFDTLAGPERACENVAPLVQRLARATLGVHDTTDNLYS